MSIFFRRYEIILLVLIPISLGGVACTTETYQSTPGNSFYASGPNSQFTGNMLTTPNNYTYYYPIQFGHVDVHANDVYTPVYQAPLAIYPHYQPQH